MAYGKMFRPVLLALLIISLSGLAANSQVTVQGDTKTELEKLKSEIKVMKAEIIILQNELDKVKAELESYKSVSESEYPVVEADPRAIYQGRADKTTYVDESEVPKLLKEYYDFYRRDFDYKDLKIKRIDDTTFQISLRERLRGQTLWLSVVRKMFVREDGTVRIINDLGY